MFYYLLCSTPCAVKLDGVFIGKATENYAIIDSERGFLEILPLGSSFGGVTKLLGENVENDDVKVLPLGKEGKLLLPIFKRKLFSAFKLIGRREIDFASGKVFLTCYAENGVRLVLENYKDMQIESVPFYPDEVLIEKIETRGGAYLLVFLCGKRTMALAFKVGEKIELAFKSACDSYTLSGNVLTLTEFKTDVLKHIVSTSWQFGAEVKAINLSVKRRREAFSINEKLIPYAFFEEFIVRGDYADFLTARLKPKAIELKEFLGGFTAVLPPPHFKKQNLVLLLYPDKVKYAELSFSKNLIDNVSLFDPDEV